MPIPSDPVRQPRLLLRDHAHRELQAAILNGTLAPGERLADEDLTAWLGVSRAPVREALSRLAQVGLVHMEANRSTNVAPRSATTYQFAREYLRALEKYAVMQAVEQTPQRRAGLVDLCEDLDARVRGRDADAADALASLFEGLVRELANPLITERDVTARLVASFHQNAVCEGPDWLLAEERIRDLHAL